MNPLSVAALPFAPPSPFAGKRVFAHYFETFPLSIDNKPAPSDYYTTQFLTPTGENGKHVAYGGFLRQRPLQMPPAASGVDFKAQNMAREVSLAIARGITGFCYDILSLGDGLTGNLPKLLTAAAMVDGRFKIIPMFDMVSLGSAVTPSAVASVMAMPVSVSPAAYRLADGRLVMAAYNAQSQTLAWWQSLISQLNNAGINVAFLPVLPSSGQTPGALLPASWGVGGWGTATPGPSAALTAAPAHAAGVAYMLPVGIQQCRPKDSLFWEAGNSAAFRAAWAAAITTGADCVQCVTWSDYSESSQVAPSTDATLNPSIGTGFYDMTAYYAAWFASGVQPVITQDVLYWIHRRMTAAAPHPGQAQGMSPVLAGGTPEEDHIEVVSFLTQPGTVVINGSAFQCPAGISSSKAALTPGFPKFALQRNGSNVFSATGPVQIYAGALPS
jgi:hypothetical protein